LPDRSANAQLSTSVHRIGTAQAISQLKAVQQATADQGAKIHAHLTPEHA
jgi:hypothetical protein